MLTYHPSKAGIISQSQNHTELFPSIPQISMPIENLVGQFPPHLCTHSIFQVLIEFIQSPTYIGDIEPMSVVLCFFRFVLN